MVNFSKQLKALASFLPILILSASSGSHSWLNNGHFETNISKSGEYSLCELEINDLTIMAQSDCGINDAAIVIDLSAPEGMPEFSLDNGLTWNSLNLIENLAPGSYNLVLRYIDGSCEIAYSGNPIVISPLAVPVLDTVILTSPSTCSSSDGRVEVRGMNGIAPLEYSLDGMNWTTDSLFTGLAVGIYFPQIRNNEGNCGITLPSVELISEVNNCQDIIIVAIPQNTNTEVCLTEVVHLSGDIASAHDCTVNDSEISVALDQSSDCITLMSSPTFLGIDTVCVAHCDDSVPALCDTTFLVVRVTPPSDSITVNILSGSIQQFCMPDFGVNQYTTSGATSSSLCAIGDTAQVIASVASNDCVNLKANALFEGEGPVLCFIQCYEYTGTLCDTTYIKTVVTPDPCTGLFTEFNSWWNNPSCIDDFEWCSELPINSIENFEVTIDGALFSNPIVACTMNDTFAAFMLSSGTHEIEFNDVVNGCLHNFEVEIIPPVIGDTTFTVSNTVCGPSYSWCTDMSADSIANFEVAVNGVVTSGPLESCGSLGSEVSINLTTGVNEVIFKNIVTNCNYTATITVQELIISGQEISIDNPSCSLPILWCSDYSLDSMDHYEVKINGALFAGPFDSCATPDAHVAFALLNGVHQIEFTKLSDGCIFPYTLTVISVDAEVFYAGPSTIAVDCDTDTLICLTAPFADVEDIIVTEDGVELVKEDCGGYVGVRLGVATHNLLIERTSTGCVTSEVIEVSCMSETPCPAIFPADTAVVLANCSDKYVICLPILKADLSNYMFTNNGIPFSVIGSQCENFVSLELAEGTYQFAILDISTNCADELMINISCGSPCDGIFPQTTLTTDAISCDDLYQMCIPLAESEQPFYTIFVNDELYIPQSQDCGSDFITLNLPSGDYLIEVENTSISCSDELILNIPCNPELNSDVLVIPAGSSAIYCLELQTKTDYVFNNCPEQSGEYAVVTESSLGCFEIIGVEAGEETACFVSCSSQGDCDTLFLNITVEEPKIDLPIANDDSYDVIENGEFSANVLENDSIFGELKSFYLINQPDIGFAWYEPNGAIFHAVNPQDSCKGVNIVAFDYKICNAVGCDTARITIHLSCDPMEPITGFSPNGDGINETFIVKGISAYPNATLTVYNRYGAQVYEATNYQNDWGGTWEDGILSDGTYFYVLLDGQGAKQSGWVEIQR